MEWPGGVISMRGPFFSVDGAQRCISKKDDDEYELLQLEKDSSTV